MQKIKHFKVSVIQHTISKATYDQNIFYTSDSELQLKFKLIEKEYSYDSGEILLFNETDKSFVTRGIDKVDGGFVYQIDDDIIRHYGEWTGQLQLVKNGEVYTSKPFQFTIENDLSSVSPPQLIDINNWATLKQSAIELIDDMQTVISEYDEAALEFQQAENVRMNNETDRIQAESTRQNHETTRQNQERDRERNEVERKANEVSRDDNETIRQQAEQGRVSAESIRVENEEQRVLNYENMQETIESIGKVKLVNDIDVSITANGEREITKAPELTQKDDNIINYLKNNIIVGDKYYISIEVKTKGIGGRMFFYSAGGGGGNYVSLVTSDEYNLASKIVTGASNFALVRLANITGQEQATGIVYRNVYTINLTKIFGEGNEPSKEVMDWIIKGNDYFDELSVSRDDIQQYEINQLRNAIIALGGTI